MKRKIELLLAILLLAGLVAALRAVENAEKRVSGDVRETVIVIDAGHGGDDPGKVGVNDALEKDINLAIAKKLQKIMEEKGIKTRMTREDEGGLYAEGATNKKVEDMKKRVEIINEVKPVLVVSIHQNSYHEEGVKGAQVFYYTHSTEGEQAAVIMQEALLALDKTNTRKAKANDTYYMLKRTEVPTIIVECGFLSNQEEAEKLVTEEYQQKTAEVICFGIEEYLSKKGQ